MSLSLALISLVALQASSSAHAAAVPKHQDAGFTGYRSVGYFTNWGIYDPQLYYVTNITNPQDYTHINYAFANVDGETGTVFLSDEYADFESEYPGDDVDADGTNLFGDLKQFFLLKEKNRNLKLMLSIGGATYSSNFMNITDQTWRETFANTSVALLQNYGFDGLDIDYEYPLDNQTDATVDLFRLVREGLDAASNVDGCDRYLLTWAASCGVDGWSGINAKAMDQYMDFWNLMAYDFSGEWTDLALPASNLYPDQNPANDVGASGAQCVQHYLDEGISSRKLVLGMPLYGTGFNDTKGMWTAWTDLGGGDYASPETTTSSTSLSPTRLFTTTRQSVLHGPTSPSPATSSPSTPQPSPFKRPNTRGGSRKKNFGRHKGAPWPLPAGLSAFKRSVSGVEGAVEERALVDIEVLSSKTWKVDLDDEICTNLGLSLVDTVATAFRKYGGGLDRSKNSLNYPQSDYDNIRNKMD
ncbi:hypothetical protein IAT38_002145 [Cryptococcus sp. DSM 104549]